MIGEAEDRRAHLPATSRTSTPVASPPTTTTAPTSADGGPRPDRPMTVDRGAPRSTGGFALANGGRAFRHRNYRLFFGGQPVSLVGTWMQQVAQAWLVLQLTHDPLFLGLVSALQFLPVLVFGLFGGIIADVLPKRRTLIGDPDDPDELAFILFGLVATDAVEVWHILVLATLLGITNAVDMPTRQAFTVEMVGRGDVANAVALNSAIFNGARIIGPAIAGLTIGSSAATWRSRSWSTGSASSP